ncbi:ABC transporter ATP-binding protein [Thalassococcus sp. S3]|uniref:ABC transporter ATP-binding protein n=1 Tax=Thalassococcus sp. S3 TaxID=2017482 RepID=UPI0010248826|nr:ABC transporter ATP-binding protein [Thalassococcus sp. S3]QBF32631.1 ABC transporter ATP-binding protein [Thalassococcus sp. S3]
MHYSPIEVPLKASGLAKRFGAVQAVSNVNLEVGAGTALGLLGPNGAGKSTTLSILMGLLAPDAGEARVFGHAAGSPEARTLTGATPQSAGFPAELTPREVLHYTAACYGTPLRLDELVDRFGLEALVDRRIAGFSGGEVRRVALALAFAGSPKLVFLDEPTTGLDTASQKGFREVARTYVAEGGALVLTSHHWDEIEAICDSITLIDKGETVLNAHIDDMRARTKAKHLSFALPRDTAPPDWMQARHDGQRWHVETAQSDAVLRQMVEEALPFDDLALEPLALEALIEHIRQEEALQ